MVIEKIKADYETGKYTIKGLAEKYGISAGKAYYMLRDAKCIFSRRWRQPMSEEARKKIGERHKGKKLSEAQRKMISERNSCGYNGLNGYGHTKVHNHGYVLANAPNHPKAHKDGYIMLHRVIMERSIGRYLNDDEEVHHVNHDRADNRLENLRLMNKHEHRSMHMRERKQRRNDLSIA